jgi:hypothetical protein
MSIVLGKDLVRKSDGHVPLILGNIHDCGDEYVAYDGADYIGFKKSEYDLKDIET